jgi:DNA polymerase family A
MQEMHATSAFPLRSPASLSSFHTYLQRWRQVWVIDTEFTQPAGDPVLDVVCLCGVELLSGREIRLWRDELATMKAPPFPIDASTLLVTFFASAEMSTFLKLGWPAPTNLIDCYAEFRLRQNNGRGSPLGYGLAGACATVGFANIDVELKEAMRGIAARGAPFSDDERVALLRYCGDDATATAKLFLTMLPEILERDGRLDYAMLRGRYCGMALAKMEAVGIPVDVPLLDRLRQRWPELKRALVREVDTFNIFDESLSFRYTNFERFLAHHNLPWPRLESGKPAIDDETFKAMVERHRELAPLRELRQLRKTLAGLRPTTIPVGRDGRARCILSPWGSLTSRNQPSSAKFIFSAAAWLRSLALAPPGRAICYVDWSQQEFLIGGVLAGDQRMIDDYYAPGADVYAAFARSIGMIPLDGTKRSHPLERERAKTAVLAIGYGMEEHGLSQRLGIPLIDARTILEGHRRTYSRYWEWISDTIDAASLRGTITTRLGWRFHCGPNVKVRTLSNYGAQAHGAEMMRCAAVAMTEADLAICAPVHDAFLQESPIDELHEQVATARALMERASEAILGGGYRLRTDAEIFAHPTPFRDKRGSSMWSTVSRLLAQIEGANSGGGGALEATVGA